MIRTVNVIAGGFAGGGMTKLARKKHLQEVLSLSWGKIKKPKPSLALEIVFSSFNLEGIILGHDPMVISAIMVNVEVKKVFVDQGSSVDIIFRDAFNKRELKNSLIGFSREKIHPEGFITLHLTLGS